MPTGELIPLWHGPFEHRIRIPGPGETFDKPADVIILPVIRRDHLRPPRRLATKPRP